MQIYLPKNVGLIMPFSSYIAFTSLSKLSSINKALLMFVLFSSLYLLISTPPSKSLVKNVYLSRSFLLKPHFAMTGLCLFFILLPYSSRLNAFITSSPLRKLNAPLPTPRYSKFEPTYSSRRSALFSFENAQALLCL